MKKSNITAEKQLLVKKLSMANSGDEGRIVSVHGDNRFLSRITSMGLTIGSAIEVIQNENKRPILVHARDTMIAINRKECEKILLEVMEK